MHDGSRWLADLVALGLTQYEAKVYLSLVRRHSGTAAEVARDADVPRQRVYDVLTRLLERGIVWTRPVQPVRYAAVAPELAMDRLIAAHRANLSELEENTRRLIDALVPAWADGPDEDGPTDVIHVVRDSGTLAARFDEIQSSAERRMLSMAKLPYLISDNPVGLEATQRLRAAGGDVRCVYEYAALADPRTVATIQTFVAAGEEVRIVERVLMRMCLVDDSRALLSLGARGDGPNSGANAIVEHPELAQCLTYAFEAIWADAEPLDRTLVSER